MRAVLQVLVLGVGVDGGHQTLDDADTVVEGLGHGSQAVGGAGCVGDDVVDGRIVLVVIDAHDDGDVLVLGGSRDQDLLGAGVQVGLGLGGVGEETGGLNDDVDAQLTPGKVRRIPLGEGLDLLAADLDGVIVVGDFFGEASEDGVVLQEMGEGLVVSEIVDGNHLEVSAGCDKCAEVVAADAAKAVDSNLDGHFE